MKMIKKIIRVRAVSLLSILVLIFILWLFVYFNTEQRINKKYNVSIPALAIPSDSGAIAKGRHLFLIRGCGDCHGSNMEGKIFLNDAKLAKITAPNLTNGKGGLAADYSVADWVRTLKHGVDRDGRSLLMMPSHETTKMSDEDMANLIAYCRQATPVDNELPKLHQLGPLGRIVLILDKATVLPAEKIEHNIVTVPGKRVTTGADYGKYLSVGCEGCHRSNMQGGAPLAPGFPAVPDITSRGNAARWTQDQFIHTLRTGIRPDGSILKNENMPWQTTKHFTDTELKALYTYLQSLPVSK